MVIGRPHRKDHPQPTEGAEPSTRGATAEPTGKPARPLRGAAAGKGGSTPPPSASQPSVPLSGLRKLVGTVKTTRPNSNQPFGVPWENVARYATWFDRSADDYQVDPYLMPAMALIESDANQTWPTGPHQGQVITRDDGFGDGLSVGMLQVKPRIWRRLAPAADAYTVEGNIELDTAIMAQAIRQQGSWQQAITRVYFPSDDPNGTTQNAYVQTVDALMREMKGQLQAKPEKPPEPKPVPVDPIRVIVGGVAYPPIDYGWLSDAGLPYYQYIVGHGGTRNTQHTGYDVGVPLGTRLFTPVAGVVDCVGDQGTPRWGQGCGAYNDTITGGVGNITVYDATHGIKLTLGHCNRAYVRPGDRVESGQQVGTSGGMNGPHVHVEVSTLRDGRYWLVDPGPALVAAMGGEMPTTYPTPEPITDPNLYTVRVVKDGVPVKLRAEMSAGDAAKPYAKGETFLAVSIILGNDNKDWWYTTTNGRVPVEGTERV